MTYLDIHFRDLNLETQKKILDFYGYNSESEGNFDHFPLFILELEE